MINDKLDFRSLNFALWSFSIVVSLFLFGWLFFDWYTDNKNINNDLETSCFEYYKENNYVLEKCLKYEEKLKKVEEK